MPKIDLSMNHNLSQEEALGRVKTLLSNVKTQFADKISNLEESWNGNEGEFSFKAMGFSVSGTLVVAGNSVYLKGNLPFAAGFFKGKIESTIREHAEKLLAS